MNIKIILIASLIMVASAAMACHGNPCPPHHNPCPEPASIATLLVGAIAAFRKRAR
jgi:hypothetical protein